MCYSKDNLCLVKRIIMKSIILLGIVTLVTGDKLDRTYLPPSNAQTSGGSANFLQTPNFPGSSHDFRRNQQPSSNFGRTNTFRGHQSNGNKPTFANGLSNQENFGRTNQFTTKGGFENSPNYSTNQQGRNFGRNNDFTRGNTPATSFDHNDDNVVVNSALNNFEDDVNRPQRPQASLERSAGVLRQDSENNGDSYAYSYETENGIFAEENGVATNGVEAQGGFSYTGDDGKVYSIRYTADKNGFVPQGDHIPTAPPIPEEILRALEQNAADEAAGIFDDGTYDARKYGDESSNDENNFDHNLNVEGRNSGQVNTAYLPPFQSDSSKQNQRVAGRNENVERKYLPPTAQSQNERFGARNRAPSFSARNGYQY